jgi:hypothetical protein
MHRREFITAAVGTAAAVASASQAFAEDYPDFGAIRKMPAGAASKGIEGEAGAPKKGIIEKITEAIGGGEMEQMHPPKYNALEKNSIECVATGNDCLRHCLGMFAMKDTSMTKCADTASNLLPVVARLHPLPRSIRSIPPILPKWSRCFATTAKRNVTTSPRSLDARPAATRARPAQRNAIRLPPKIKSAAGASHAWNATQPLPSMAWRCQLARTMPQAALTDQKAKSFRSHRRSFGDLRGS